VTRLLLAAALIAVAAPAAHAWQTLPGKDVVISDRLTPQWRLAPPLHPVWENEVPITEIPRDCGFAASEKLSFYGCSWTSGDTCFVYIAAGLSFAQHEAVMRHERAHCAGMHHAVMQP
jgi:hypothetical protein